MADNKAKILMLVEGAKTDVNLMQHLLKVYNISEKHEIVPYKTNIYVLYNLIFKDEDTEALDLLQVLKESEKDNEKKKIFEERYSDILLVFDLDPQDALYSKEKIFKMLDYFSESSENGKLYLNYPMVEAFYHMSSIPDNNFNHYIATMSELKNKEYKRRVQMENRDHDYRKFAQTKDECDWIIIQNYKKAELITGEKCSIIPESTDIFNVQASKITNEECVYVLCTCVFYIMEYNSDLVKKSE